MVGGGDGSPASCPLVSSGCTTCELVWVGGGCRALVRWQLLSGLVRAAGSSAAGPVARRGAVRALALACLGGWQRHPWTDTLRPRCGAPERRGLGRSPSWRGWLRRRSSSPELWRAGWLRWRVRWRALPTTPCATTSCHRIAEAYQEAREAAVGLLDAVTGDPALLAAQEDWHL